MWIGVTLTHRHNELSVERCGGGELGVWSLTGASLSAILAYIGYKYFEASRNVPMAFVILVLWLVQDMCNRRIPVGRAAAGWEQLRW